MSCLNVMDMSKATSFHRNVMDMSKATLCHRNVCRVLF